MKSKHTIEQVELLFKFVSRFLLKNVWQCRPNGKSTYAKFQHTTRLQFRLASFSIERYETFLITEKGLYDPAYLVMKGKGEKLVMDVKLKENWDYIQSNLDDQMSLLARNPGSDEMLWSMLIAVFQGLKIPAYQWDRSNKKHHLFYHHFTLMIFYVLARLLGVDKHDSYRLAGKYARNSAVDPSTELEIRNFIELSDFKKYCDERDLIFNVVVKGISDAIFTLNKMISIFIVVEQVSGSEKCRISKMFYDSGTGVAVHIPAKNDLNEIVRKRFASIVSGHGGVRAVVKQSRSIQEWPNDERSINISLRAVSRKPNDQMLFKCTIWRKPIATYTEISNAC